MTCPVRLEPYENLTVYSVLNPAQRTNFGGEVYLVEGRLILFVDLHYFRYFCRFKGSYEVKGQKYILRLQLSLQTRICTFSRNVSYLSLLRPSQNCSQAWRSLGSRQWRGSGCDPKVPQDPSPIGVPCWQNWGGVAEGTPLLQDQWHSDDPVGSHYWKCYTKSKYNFSSTSYLFWESIRVLLPWSSGLLVFLLYFFIARRKINRHMHILNCIYRMFCDYDPCLTYFDVRFSYLVTFRF